MDYSSFGPNIAFLALQCGIGGLIIRVRTIDPPQPVLMCGRPEGGTLDPGGVVEGLGRMATVDKMPMLQEGYDKLVAELKRLKIERPLIVDAIEEARAHGDLSENAEYHAAKEQQGQNEATIADIEGKLSRAQIIDPRELSGDKVVFGATVTLLDEDDKPIKYQIVGETEADASKGRISYNSPIGRALIGRKVDEEVEVSVPAGDRYYLVSQIEFI
jgi:transcription elongation factor GreA